MALIFGMGCRWIMLSILKGFWFFQPARVMRGGGLVLGLDFLICRAYICATPALYRASGRPKLSKRP